MAETTRDFDLGDVLSITTGRLVSRRHMAGVYDILNFMTSDSLFTHQLPRAARECRPALLQQHPQIAAIEVPALTPDTYLPWLLDQEATFGARLAVTPLGREEHVQIDPILEAQVLVGKGRVVALEASRG